MYGSRKIIHCDLDSFFASVEQRDRPSLRGKPVIICGFNGGRGVVSTASYEARKYGIHSGMPGYKARKLCPRGYFIAPDFEKYRRASDQVYDIFYKYTNIVEPGGMDEAYLDVTYNKKGIPSAKWVAEDIRYDVYKATGLTISAGVAPNKLVAKIASDFQKPNGLTVVPPEKVREFLYDLPVRKIPGIGPVTESICWSFNIKKVSDFLRYSDDVLEEFFGRSGPDYRLCALGIDNRPLVLNRIRKSCGIEDTLMNDISTKEEAYPILEDLAKKLERRLLINNTCGRTVTLKVKYSNFQLITRRKTLITPINDWRTLLSTAKLLLDQSELGERKVRLLGIAVSQLQDGLVDPPPIQPKLFD
jgi:DNA polymerase-4